MKRFELEGSQAKILHTDQSYIYISALKENTESNAYLAVALASQSKNNEEMVKMWWKITRDR